jgi:hypothetical protein
VARGHPYVDLWDRKPLGLFLIYGAASAFPGNAVIAYQLMAMAAAAATAVVIARCARLLSGPRGAMFAGLAYLIYLMAFNCGMGQAPVFYDLPMMLAGWLVIGALARTATVPPRDTGLLRRGCLAMALVGMALQIKTSVVIEVRLWPDAGVGGVARRLALAAPGRQCSAVDRPRPASDRDRLCRLCRAGAGANLPGGQCPVDRWPGAGSGEATFRLAKVLVALIPFYVALWIGWRRAALCPQGMMARRGVLLWLGMAVIGFLAPGTWYDHYVAPALMPLAILAAPALDGRCRVTGWLRRGLRGRPGRRPGRHHRAGAQVRHRSDDDAAAAIRPHIDANHCLYVYEGDSALYRATQSCLPTRFAFPPTFPRGLKNMRWASIQPPKWRGSWPVARAVVIDESAHPYAPNLRTRGRLAGAGQPLSPHRHADPGNALVRAVRLALICGCCGFTRAGLARDRRRVSFLAQSQYTCDNTDINASKSPRSDI